MGMMVFDQAPVMDKYGNYRGKVFDHSLKTHDGKTVDSTGAFLTGELERLDLKLHGPLVDVTWPRDIQLREDVTIADEVSSFTQSTYGAPGGLGIGGGVDGGIAWMGKSSSEIASVSLDINKVPHPLRLWAMEIAYTIPELESAARIGRPIDSQKFDNLNLKHEMDTDKMVYVGDTSLGSTVTGLINDPGVTPTSFPVGANGSTLWSTKTPDEILADTNSSLVSVWTNSAFAVMPSEMRLPPAIYGYISMAKVSNAGNISILKYILENNVVTQSGRGRLNIQPLKWLIGSGVGGTLGTPGTDRMMLYVNEIDRVRYVKTLLQKTPIQYDSLWHKTTYFCRLGQLELVYPTTIGYFDLL